MNTLQFDAAGCVDVAGSEAMEDLILIVGGAVEGAGLATEWSPELSHWSRSSRYCALIGGAYAGANCQSAITTHFVFYVVYC